jgi:transcriptional regulator with XRE-family HTH domain
MGYFLCSGNPIKVSKSIYSQRQEVLQELLRTARLDANLTQLELANKLRRPQSFVSKIESGERLLDVLELKEVCDGLGLTLVEFAKRIEDALS